MSDSVLIGWLCMAALGLRQDAIVFMPEHVRTALVTRGWVKLGNDEWDAQVIEFTDAGQTVIDLNSADWGVDVLSEVDA